LASQGNQSADSTPTNNPHLSFDPKETSDTQTGRSPGLRIIAFLFLPIARWRQWMHGGAKENSSLTVAGPRWIFTKLPF